MKKLLFLILFAGCEVIDNEYYVREGKNVFKPLVPTMPFTGKTLEYTFSLGEEWWVGDLTYPVGYGCKLPAVGRFNYHNGGANFAISCVDCHVYITPRYYEPISGGNYRLHEINNPTKLTPNVNVRCKIIFGDSTWFFVNDRPVLTVPYTLPHDWIAPSFLGRSGNDNNYPGGPKPGAFASRDLRLKIQHH